jgi:L-lactate dehydrogenase complex protein LldG
MSGRDIILTRIRAALSDVPVSETPEDVEVARTYRRRAEWSRKELVEQLAERLLEYKATVHRHDTNEIQAAVSDACERRGVRRLVVPEAIEPSWIPSGLQALRDPGLSKQDLDGSDGVLTGCRLAIADTGTIVLDCGPDQGRRALSLIPDYHLCVVQADQIVGTVPEAVAALEAGVRAAPRPVTFISGPSATSDIEFRRVEGVHGPRVLEVLLIPSPSGESAS